MHVCSASTFSGCIHRYLSKAIISFPTNSEVAELSSSANTRLEFDTSVLIGEKEQKLIYNIRNRDTNQCCSQNFKDG